MKVTFLGTAASNAFPEAFCKCQNCEQARALGGRSLRKRSSLLINDDLLIDLSPDLHTAAQMHGISLTEVHCCLQTHFHADHMDLSQLLSRSPGFGTVGAPVLHFYASEGTLQRGAATFERDLADYSLLDPEAEGLLNLKIHRLDPFNPMMIGAYRVTGYPANHAYGSEALLYSVEHNDKAIFYGTDTSVLFEETWQAFHQFDRHFDLVILDHTYGWNQKGNDHLSANQFIEHIRRMREEGLLKPEGRAYATHISHESNPAYPELSQFARQNGYEIAWDGLVIEV